jgi:hypothetical protein
MPRFGLPWFAHRLPRDIGPLAPQVRGDGIGAAFELAAGDLEPLARRDLVADFHCVTTWSCRQQSWSGYAFREVFEYLILPRAGLMPTATHVRFKGVDGYADTLLLEDALAPNVLLADRHFVLRSRPLTVPHSGWWRRRTTGTRTLSTCARQSSDRVFRFCETRSGWPTTAAVSLTRNVDGVCRGTHCGASSG